MIFVPGTRPGRPLTTDQQREVMASAFGGAFAGSGYACQRLDYPAKFWPLTGASSPTLAASIARGVPMLDAAIKGTTGDTVVVGFSQGCMVIENCEPWRLTPTLRRPPRSASSPPRIPSGRVGCSAASSRPARPSACSTT